MRSRILLAVVLAVIAIGAYGGVQLYRAKQSQDCGACHRPLDHGAKTVAMVNGKRVGYCCPSCAVSEHQQTGARVEIQRLTDHLTGAELAPAGAYLVRGSDVNPCAQHHAVAFRGPDKRPIESHYDRCSPSLLAFSTRQAALDFSRTHGGQVLAFSDLAAHAR